MAVPDRRPFSPELIPATPSTPGMPNRYGHHRYDDAVYRTAVDGQDVTVFLRQGVYAPYLIEPVVQDRVRRGFFTDGDRMLDKLGSEEKQLLLRNLLSAIRVINKETLFPELKQMVGQTINHVDVDPENSLTPEAIKAELLNAPVTPRFRSGVRAENLGWLIETAEMLIPKLPQNGETMEQVRATFYAAIEKIRTDEKAFAEPLRQRVDSLVPQLPA